MADVERADIVWRKSPSSGATGCVEVAFEQDAVLIRHSKDPAGAVLEFTHTEWAAFLIGARDGAFDLRP